MLRRARLQAGESVLIVGIGGGVSMAALALAKGAFYAPSGDNQVETPFDDAPSRVLVTGVGHWRGEGLALIERVP